MVDDFDGGIIGNEEADGFYSPNVRGQGDPDLDAKVREATYVAEIEQIERLTESLNGGVLAKTELTPEAWIKGIAILKARRESVESLYDGRSINEIRESEFDKKERVYELQTGQPIPPRQQAIIRGLETYQSGDNCRNGHVNPERSTTNAGCMKCRRANYERFKARYKTTPV